MTRSAIAIFITFMLVFPGCKHDEQKMQTHERQPGKPKATSLYARLGGESAIRAVVNEFVASASADPKVNFTRQGTGHEWNATPENVQQLKERLVQFIGEATGGPQVYKGQSMDVVHHGMKITNAEFDAAAADLKAAMEKLNVPVREQNELMKIISGTRAAIVEETPAKKM